MLKLRNSSEMCFPACFRQISISNIHFKLENTNIKNSCLKYLNVQLKPSYCPSTNSALTTPFWTLKPSWYLVSGRFILTSTTGAHETAVSLTAVLFLVFCNGEVFRGIDERDGDRLALGRGGKTRSGAVRRKAMLSELSQCACMCAKTTLSLKRGRKLKYPFIFSSFRRNRGSNVK